MNRRRFAVYVTLMEKFVRLSAGTTGQVRRGTSQWGMTKVRFDGHGGPWTLELPTKILRNATDAEVSAYEIRNEL